MTWSDCARCIPDAPMNLSTVMCVALSGLLIPIILEMESLAIEIEIQDGTM
jgi:hypothetical protein